MWLAAAIAMLLATTVALGLAEVATRIVDKLPLWPIALPVPPHPTASRDERATADRPYVAGIPLADGVDPAWYAMDPPPHPEAPPPPPDVLARYERYKNVDPYGAFMVWNRKYLVRNLCAGSTYGSMGIEDSFYTFDPIDGTEYPVYSHIPHLHLPGWFVPNSFGWRGPEVPLDKPADTVRIAFLGSSTTVDAYALAYSHTELLEHWLNLWAARQPHPFHVEVLNTARTGIDSHSVTAIAREELAPLEPDLTIYEGANSFQPAQLLRRVGVLPAAGPRPNVATTWRLEKYSAIARRLRPTIDVWMGNNGWEPRKVRHIWTWPSDISETDPAIGAALPLGLKDIVSDLDTIHGALEGAGGQLATVSLVWMVKDGMKLELPRDLNLYTYLNVGMAPLTYAQLRRAADFQNRVFANYAKARHTVFFDIASEAPLDPLLFNDAIHMTDRGLRIQAWIYLQKIVPWLEQQIAAGRLPRAMQHPLAEHPMLHPETYRLETKAALVASCPH